APARSHSAAGPMTAQRSSVLADASPIVPEPLEKATQFPPAAISKYLLGKRRMLQQALQHLRSNHAAEIGQFANPRPRPEAKPKSIHRLTVGIRGPTISLY